MPFQMNEIIAGTIEFGKKTNSFAKTGTNSGNRGTKAGKRSLQACLGRYEKRTEATRTPVQKKKIKLNETMRLLLPISEARFWRSVFSGRRK